MPDALLFAQGGRVAAIRWIDASGFSYAHMARYTGVPYQRLTSGGLRPSDLLLIASYLDSERPFLFEEEWRHALDDGEKVLHTLRAMSRHADPAVAADYAQRAESKDRELEVYRLVMRPLTEQWAEDATPDDDPRNRSCARCTHEWKTRTSGRPQRCPRCRSPHWDRVEAGTGAR